MIRPYQAEAIEAIRNGPRLIAIPTAHSPLFDAARELLRPYGDASAAVWRLRTSYPTAGLDQCRRMLREVATQLHVNGEQHA